jgi:hypothetical protein
MRADALGGPLARFFAWLVYEPAAMPGDPPWPRDAIRPGDLVEIATDRDVIGRCRVIAASARHFKISDHRVFCQARRWALFSRPGAIVRARKVR